MRSLPHALLLGALATTALAACDEPAPTRVWRPEDHAHPAGSVDPSRMVAPSEPQPGTARERAIAALYQVHCASCHGADGRGQGPGRAPVMQIPDFTSSEWQGTREDDALARTIAAGGNMMPAFADRIAEENIRGLVAYVRAFGAEPAEVEAPAAPGGAPPSDGASTAE